MAKCYKLTVYVMAENLDDLWERLEDTSSNPIDDFDVGTAERHEEGDTE